MDPNNANTSNPALMNVLLGLLRALSQMRQQEIASQREEAATQNPQYRLQLDNAMKRKSRAIAESIGVPAEFAATRPIAPGEDDEDYKRRIARQYAEVTGLRVDSGASPGKARALRRRDRERQRRERADGYWRMQWKLPGQKTQVRSNIPESEDEEAIIQKLRDIQRRYGAVGTYAP